MMIKSQRVISQFARLFNIDYQFNLLGIVDGILTVCDWIDVSTENNKIYYAMRVLSKIKLECTYNKTDYILIN